MQLNIPDAKMELAVLDAQTTEYSKAGVLAHLKSKGLAAQSLSGMQELWEQKGTFAGQTFNIGRVIAVEMLNFVRATPNRPCDMSIGAAATTLHGMVPFLRPILAPLAMLDCASGEAASLYPATGNDELKSGLLTNNEELLVTTRHFFLLLAAIFNALENEMSCGSRIDHRA